MSNENQVSTNYSKEQEERILSCIPFDFAMAKSLAEEMGKKPMSIVAKVKRMESEARKLPNPLPLDGGSWYTKQASYVSKTGKPVTKKSDRIANIAAMLNIPAFSLENWNTVRAVEEIEAAVLLLLKPKTPIIKDE